MPDKDCQAMLTSRALKRRPASLPECEARWASAEIGAKQIISGAGWGGGACWTAHALEESAWGIKLDGMLLL
jgi:hypothetical protein